MELSNELAQSIIASQAGFIRRLQMEQDDLERRLRAVRKDKDEFSSRIIELESALTDSKFANELAIDSCVKLELKLKIRDGYIDEFSQTIAMKDARIVELELELETRDTRIVELSRTIAAQDACVVELKSMVDARDKALIELATDATAAESQLAATQLELAAKDKRLESAKKNLTWLEQCLSVRNATINQLSAKLWSITKSS